MSLAQHVTQAQGFDYESPARAGDLQTTDRESLAPLSPRSTGVPNRETNGSDWRRLSYAPVDFPRDQRPRRAAYKVSNFKRAGKRPFVTSGAAADSATW